MKAKPQFHSTVFLDIMIEDKVEGRLTIDLYRDTPKTSDNFKQLCTGESTSIIDKSRVLSFKNSIFHRIVPGFLCQAGDITNYDGTGGESIYGRRFKHENFKH